MDIPCHGCAKRWVDGESGKNCHGSCEAYLAFARARAEELAREQEARANERALIHWQRKLKAIDEYYRRHAKH